MASRSRVDWHVTAIEGPMYHWNTVVDMRAPRASDGLRPRCRLHRAQARQYADALRYAVGAIR